MSPHGGFFLEHDLIRVFDKFTGDVDWSSSASVLELFGSCFYLVRRDLGTIKGLGGPSKGSKGGTVLSALSSKLILEGHFQSSCRLLCLCQFQ